MPFRECPKALGFVPPLCPPLTDRDYKYLELKYNMPIHHFTDPEKVTTFMSCVRAGESTLENAYKKTELIQIGKDLGLLPAQLKGIKKIITNNILKKCKKYGPGLEATLRQNVLDEYMSIQKEDTQTNKEYHKPYRECTLEELKEEADSEQILSSGSRHDIIRRLERIDNGKGSYEDSTSDWIRNELAKNGFLDSGNRTVLLERAHQMDDTTNISFADRTTVYLKQYLEKEKLTHSGTREDCLLRLYPIEIHNLKNKLNELTLQLEKKTKVIYRTKYRSSPNKKTGTLTSLGRGLVFGAGVGLGARIIRGRKNFQKSSLKF